jgi:hypothetical protein
LPKDGNLLWVYDATKMPILSEKFTGNHCLKNDEAVIFGKLIITKERSPGMGYYF